MSSAPDPPVEPSSEPDKKLAQKSKAKTRSKQPGGKRQTNYPIITKNRLFVTVLAAVIVFMFFALILIALLSFFGKDPPTQLQSKLFDICYFIITTSLGTILGLIGGKASSHDAFKPGDEK